MFRSEGACREQLLAGAPGASAVSSSSPAPTPISVRIHSLLHRVICTIITQWGSLLMVG